MNPDELKAIKEIELLKSTLGINITAFDFMGKVFLFKEGKWVIK